VRVARGHVLTIMALAIAALGTVGFLTRSSGDATTDSSSSSAQVSARAITTFLEGAATTEFEPLRGDWTLSLPRDHGAHLEARTETWSVTAHMADSIGDQFDLSLSFSRYGIIPPEEGVELSPWTVSALYAGQFLVFDDRDGTDHTEYRLSRGAGTAGHDLEAREIWLDDWTIEYGEGAGSEDLRIRASGVNVSIDLLLEPVKQALAISVEATASTHGFSMPRLAVSGAIKTASDKFDVSGTAWLDRLWGDVPLPGGPVAYDRLILQLSNGADLSVIQTRRIGREGAATLDGVLIDAAGRTVYLDSDALNIEVLDERRVTGGSSYPVSWQVRGEGFDLTATASTEGARQEFIAPMWLGPVAVEGEMDGASVRGSGMLSLTGYEDTP
jgi:predicted secreted hydrolase